MGLKLKAAGLAGQSKFQGCKVPNHLGVTSASTSDCQRLSRVLLLSGIERKQSKVPFESPTMVRFQEEKWMHQLKIWIAIKQSTNLELNEPVLEWE